MKKQKSVFHDLGLTETESIALTFKADLYSKILDVINHKELTSRQLERLLDIPQPRVSELMNGKLSSVSLEKLLTYLELLGVRTTLQFKNSKAA